MITIFELFENNNIDESIKHIFVIDDIAEYYLYKYKDDAEQKMQNFLSDILFHQNIKVAFGCIKCTYDDERGATNYANINKNHIGVISGMGVGVTFNDDKLVIYLTIRLKKIKYDHEVDTSRIFFTFGKLSPDFEEILKEVEFYKNIKKYNL